MFLIISLGNGREIIMFYYNFPSSTGRQKISLKQAKDIALQYIPGKIIHVDVDLDHGVLVYEVFVLTG